MPTLICKITGKTFKDCDCGLCMKTKKDLEINRSQEATQGGVSIQADCYTPMDDLEVRAEVYRIIRVNADKPKSAIMRAIKSHLPEIGIDRIAKALKELSV